MEIWKDIKGYEGLYQVSNQGRVRSLYKGVRILKTRNNKGYLRVALYKENKYKHISIHRLVAEAFLPNPKNLPQVNHKSEIKTDNRVENLEWCDSKYNDNYGNRNNKLSRKNRNNKFSLKVLQISKEGVFIKEWPSLHEIERTLGFLRANISMCCKNKRKISYGYIWKFKTEKEVV